MIEVDPPSMDGVPLTLPPSIELRLRSALTPRIAVERELAAGGMATIFAGRDRVLDRPVAIKVLPPERTTATLTERFVREARSAARLSHPNVVPIYDAGIADGIPYYVMPLLAGGTLAGRLAADGPLDASETYALARDLLSALVAMHGHGMIHRDIKPSNIFFEHGRALLGDFGIVALRNDGDDTLTGPGEVPGTPRYLAPEQLAGSPATERSDVYSLGMALY